MNPNDGFLSRWSRRKLDPRARDPETSLAPGTEPTGAEATDPALPGEPSFPAAELSEEDLAALPRLEDLTAETDLAPFLRAGVPALLRKAALRRMWSLDPAIRDFVGEARDYSYDWNVPGGVPVSGPLLPGDDVEATLGRMFSRLRDEIEPEDGPERGEPGSTTEATAPAKPISPGQEPSSASDGLEADASSALQHGRPLAEVELAAAAAVPAVSSRAGEPTTSMPPPRPPLTGRRHGAARPKFDSF